MHTPWAEDTSHPCVAKPRQELWTSPSKICDSEASTEYADDLGGLPPNRMHLCSRLFRRGCVHANAEQQDTSRAPRNSLRLIDCTNAAGGAVCCCTAIPWTAGRLRHQFHSLYLRHPSPVERWLPLSPFLPPLVCLSTDYTNKRRMAEQGMRAPRVVLHQVFGGCHTLTHPPLRAPPWLSLLTCLLQDWHTSHMQL
jgi:hypothetical protein